MSEITYNEEVTAEVINNVSVDLGSTEFSYFQDGVPYAVNELNQITADLVSPGVLRTGANGALGCKGIISDDMVYVQAGVIVFESGAKIRITEPVAVDMIPGTLIYAVYDSTTGKASLEVSETTPSGDYVLLAEVDAEGVIADRRSACVAKVHLTADTPNTYTETSVKLEDVSYSNGSYTNNKIVADMGTNAYSYIRLVGGTRINAAGETYNINPANKNPLLSKEGVKNSMTVYIDGKDYIVSVTRNWQYQEVEVIGNAGHRATGTFNLNFMVM